MNALKVIFKNRKQLLKPLGDKKKSIFPKGVVSFYSVPMTSFLVVKSPISIVIRRRIVTLSEDPGTMNDENSPRIAVKINRIINVTVTVTDL